ncbi:MAG: cytochrome c-type biogenesis CcmF C-terminal domain-containing protein, partial [Gaiellaceae bacterium]
HTVRLDRLERRVEPRRRVVQALVTLDGGERLSPALNLYRNQQQATASPAVRESPGTDVYAILVEAAQDGSAATIRVLLNPLVTWLWFGGAVILLGAAIVAVPLPRRRRLA